MAGTELLPAQSNGANIATVGGYSREHIELMKKTVAVGATDIEFELFMYQASRTGLDPLLKQIYCIKRGDSMTIQVGIDGFRLMADCTGRYAGTDDAVFTGLTSDNYPAMATVTVYKFVQGERCAFVASARWNEYCPPGNQAHMWKKMPHTMLAKVAESLALRKAFPAELSGLHTDEEMEQAAVNASRSTNGKRPAPAADAAMTDDQKRAISNLCSKHGAEPPASNITFSQAQEVIKNLQEMGQKGTAQ